MTTATWLTGDVRDVIKGIPDGSIDLVCDDRNLDLARQRVGMFLEVPA